MINILKDILGDVLCHYGVSKLDGAPGRGSGRYPWGSGDHPFQSSKDFLARIEELEKDGLNEKEIAAALKLSTTKLRIQKSLAGDERREELVSIAKRLKDEGNSLNEIARKMGYANDSSVRSLLNESSERRMNQAKVTADFLEEVIKNDIEKRGGKGIIDVGSEVERTLGDGVSRQMLDKAIELLHRRGYEVYEGSTPQVTNPGQKTNLKVIAPHGTEWKEIYEPGAVHSVTDYEKILTDGGTVIRKAFEYPESLSSKRVAIKYAEEGGEDRDGLVEIRRGLKDVSIGNDHYSQVRILVDGTHYIKGMAVYSDDLPDGIDVRFNTNKKVGTPMIGDKNNTVLKPIQSDPNNPFGALIKERGGQSYYDDPNGKFVNPTTGKKQSLNKVNKTKEEGDWDDWKDGLPSQFLAKQSEKLIKRQLNLTIQDKLTEFETIKSYTNPTIKKILLQSFASDCDSTAEHLKAAALPRQKYKVILPIPSLKDTEVYAPGYKNGEKVALVRFPHGGTFEIPILTVNNKNKEGLKVISNIPKDAVGINKKVADRLSGADFDGDTVMVIPTSDKIKIQTRQPLRGLERFDPKAEYGPSTTTIPYKRMTKAQTQIEMGKISNLITDMTLRGATDSELARAVRHSMVVIDAEKHNLDFKRSFKDNKIDELKRSYQGRVENGRYTEAAGTLISRAKGQQSVLKRQGNPKINQKGKDWYDPSRPEGALVYKTADDLTYVDKKTGKTKIRTQKSTQMMETDDARTLSSGTPQEEAYAKFANTMKDLANKARMEYVNTGKIEYSPSARKTYQAEVDSLNSKLNLSKANAPKERQAQIIANSIVAAQKESNPDLTKKEIKKLSQRALVEARERVGAKRNPIEITDREWEAIQAGAISETTLSKILNNTNLEDVQKRAMPRDTKVVTPAKQARIKAMASSGNYTIEEIASAIGVSQSTVSEYM